MESPRQNNAARRVSGRSLTSALHEINNPLESLLNLLCLVDGDPGISRASRDHLKMAEAEVMRVSKIAQAAMKRVPRPGNRRGDRRGSAARIRSGIA